MIDRSDRPFASLPAICICGYLPRVPVGQELVRIEAILCIVHIADDDVVALVGTVKLRMSRIFARRSLSRREAASRGNQRDCRSRCSKGTKEQATRRIGQRHAAPRQRVEKASTLHKLALANLIAMG
jgi:hypothetical protein